MTGSGTIVLADSNGLAFGLSGSTVTGSYTVPSTAGLISGVGASAGASSGAYTGLTFADSNGVSFGNSNGTITASVSVAAAGNTGFVSAGGVAASLGTVVFSNSNGISFGANGQTVTASHNGLTSQSTAPGGLAAGTQTGTSGTVVFANSNGLTFGMSGSSQITGSYTVPAQLSVGASTGGNTAGDTGVVTGRLVLAGGNNITLSGSTDGGSMSLTISGPAAAGAQTGVSGVQVSDATFTSGTVSLRNANGISFGSSGANGVTASYTVPAVTNSSWTASDNATSLTIGQLVFSQSNGLTLSLSTATGGKATVVGSYTVPSTAGLLSAVNLSAGTTSNNLSAFTLSNSNGLAFGLSGSTVTGSYTVPTVTNSSLTLSDAATSMTIGRLAFSQSNGLTLSLSTTTGGSATLVGSYTVPTVTNSSLSVSDAATSGTVGRLAFTNLNGLTLSLSTSDNGQHTVVGSYTVPSTAGLISAVNLSAGTTSTAAAAFTLSDGNNVSFGLDGRTVTASASFSQTAESQTLGVSNLGNTAGTSGVASGPQVRLLFAGGNNITLSQSVNGASGTITISGPNTAAASNSSLTVQAGGSTLSSLSRLAFVDSNGVSFGLSTSNNGSATVTATVKTDYLTTADLSQNSSNYLRNWKLTGNAAGTTSSAQGTDLWLAGGNNVTVSGSSNTVSFSVGNYITTARASTDAVGLNTAKTNVTWTVNSSGLSLNAGGYAGTGLTTATTAGTNLVGTNDTAGLSLGVPAWLTAAAGGGFSAGVSTGGNTAGATGVTGTRLVFVGTNAVSLSQATDAGGGTVSFDVATQTNQTLGMYALGNTAGQSSSTTVDARTLSVSAAGAGMSVGYSGGRLVLSGPPYVGSYDNGPPGVLQTVTGAATNQATGVAIAPAGPGSYSFLRTPVSFSVASTTVATSAASVTAAAGVYSTWYAGFYTWQTGASSSRLGLVASSSGGWSFENSLSANNSGSQYTVSAGFTGQYRGGTTSHSSSYAASTSNYSFRTNAMPHTDLSGPRALDVPFASSLPGGPMVAVVGFSSSTSSGGVAGLVNALATVTAGLLATQFSASVLDIANINMGLNGYAFGPLAPPPATAGTNNVFASNAVPYVQLLRSA